METGIVKWFSNSKGYGFIALDNSETDVFVHFSTIQVQEGMFISLQKGDKVEFEVKETQKGLEARKVSILEKDNVFDRDLSAWVSY